MGVVAAIGAVVAATGIVVSTIQQTKAAKQQRRLSRVQARREQVQQIRAALIQRGRATNVATQAGATGSGLAGAQASIGSQLTGNLSFLDTVTNLQNRISKALASAAVFGAVADLGSSVSTAAGGSKAIQATFGGGGKK